MNKFLLNGLVKNIIKLFVNLSRLDITWIYDIQVEGLLLSNLTYILHSLIKWAH